MKTRVQKVICVGVCILLCASFLIVPVSAAEESSSSFCTNVYMNQQEYRDVIVWTWGTDHYAPFDDLAHVDWDTLSEDNDELVTVHYDSYDFVYYNYNIDVRPPSGVPYFAISYAFIDSYILSKSLDFNFCITAGMFDFFTSTNICVTDIRFSLREFNSSNSKIGDVVAVSDFYKIGAPTGTMTNDYDVQIAAGGPIRLRNTTGFNVAPGCTVLCIDLKVVPLTLSKPFSVGIDLNSKFSFWQTSNVYGPQEAPYYPELSEPFFKGPDNSDFNGLLSVQDGVLGNYSDGGSTLSSLFSDFQSSFAKFAGGLRNVSSLLAYIVDGFPMMSPLISMSLMLGLFSFIMGLAGSIASAAGRRSSRRSNSSSEE